VDPTPLVTQPPAAFWGGWLPAMSLAWRAFDLVASAIWAASGAILGARKGFDVTGIFAVALFSATGGGLLRDGLFLQAGPPALVRTPAYVIIAGAAALVVWAFGERIPRFSRAVMIADAFGLGAFAVVGMKLALASGLSLPAVALVGVVNAVGGGVVRSILVNEVPEVFRPGEWMALAALVGCVVYLALIRGLQIDDDVASASAVGTVAVVRTLSVHYRFLTTPARGFDAPDGALPQRTQPRDEPVDRPRSGR
jgi:uncharacterized membrane protein YeiH